MKVIWALFLAILVTTTFNICLGILVCYMISYKRYTTSSQFVSLEKNIMVDEQQLDDLLKESSLGPEVEVGSGGRLVADTPSELVFETSKGLLDKGYAFKTHPFVIIGDRANTTNKWRVCLSTQTSSDLLFNIAKQAATWTGPMSVSVFVPAEDYTIAYKMIQYLRECFPTIRGWTTFHMTYPKTLTPKLVPIDDLTTTRLRNCTMPDEVNKLLVKKVRSKFLSDVIARQEYPQNLLRNIARQSCHSEFVFTPDVDMISIPNLSDELNEFLGRQSTRSCKKCAFIIPTYEISVKASANPKDKTELVRMKKMKLAQVFHIEVFKNNQNNSLLSKWEQELKRPKLDILYNITTWKDNWEPIYVTKAPVPPFDERFVGYGSTRNTQVYEMHLAGYTWHMMNNIFLTHHGFQTAKNYSFFRTAQIRANYRKRKVFKKEIYVHYKAKPNIKIEWLKEQKAENIKK